MTDQKPGPWLVRNQDFADIMLNWKSWRASQCDSNLPQRGSESEALVTGQFFVIFGKK